MCSSDLSAARARAGLSFHEQHEETGLSRRTLGADARAHVLDELSAGGTILFELDAERIQDARLWADATPLEPLDVSLEYLHTEPALFLSRQSVLSVFSTDAYDEAAAFARLALHERLSLEGEGALQLHDDGERGARGEAAVRILPGATRHTLVRIGYARVLSVESGYHSVRASLRRRIAVALTGTLEAYAYLYDRAIFGHLSSEVYAGTLTYQATDALDLLWGASLAQSPYAALDAQTLVQARYRLDFSTQREAP